ncbi:hypothetical protein [Roseobacter sp. CCS2]|uniref:hypothetical protein n=1 Tax=Roseobacter sp. CCS2 TaxID=391593 RepID=UPI0000F4001D|nr:hypothetical protein [Roseobacter sp. CCS2]EBA13343.1 hypothetical protein RCCS2_05639 [Roseobacter sp. CCS2]
MTGAIIVVAFSFYILEFIIGWGLQQAGISAPWASMIIPPLLGGLCGGMQFARTERRGMRIPRRLSCAFSSCLAIVFAPLLFAFAVLLIHAIAGGLSFLPLVPNIASFLTLAGLIQMAVFTLYGLPAIFIGLTAGQWLQYKRMIQ